MIHLYSKYFLFLSNAENPRIDMLATEIRETQVQVPPKSWKLKDDLESIIFLSSNLPHRIAAVTIKMKQDHIYVNSLEDQRD